MNAIVSFHSPGNVAPPLFPLTAPAPAPAQFPTRDYTPSPAPGISAPFAPDYITFGGHKYPRPFGAHLDTGLQQQGLATQATAARTLNPPMTCDTISLSRELQNARSSTVVSHSAQETHEQLRKLPIEPLRKPQPYEQQAQSEEMWKTLQSMQGLLDAISAHDTQVLPPPRVVNHYRRNKPLSLSQSGISQTAMLKAA